MSQEGRNVTKVVRVHYELDPDLHRRVKTAAAAEGLTLKAYLEQALEAAADKSEADQAKRKK
jgi:predicted HicB family RNase H-like nuclease